MNWLNRLILLAALLIMAGCVAQTLVGPVVTTALVGTGCFVVIAVTRYLTDRW
jgi:uncharacterized lipoprotein YajG